MGKIRGTPRMRSHISQHRATTKYFSNSFVFKNEIEKEGLPRDVTPALGAGGPANPFAGRKMATLSIFWNCFVLVRSARTLATLLNSPTETPCTHKCHTLNYVSNITPAPELISLLACYFPGALSCTLQPLGGLASAFAKEFRNPPFGLDRTARTRRWWE